MHDSSCHLQMLASHVLESLPTAIGRAGNWLMTHLSKITLASTCSLLDCNLWYTQWDLRGGKRGIATGLSPINNVTEVAAIIFGSRNGQAWLMPDTGIAQLRRLAPMRTIDFNSQWWGRRTPCTQPQSGSCLHLTCGIPVELQLQYSKSPKLRSGKY